MAVTLVLCQVYYSLLTKLQLVFTTQQKGKEKRSSSADFHVIEGMKEETMHWGRMRKFSHGLHLFLSQDISYLYHFRENKNLKSFDSLTKFCLLASYLRKSHLIGSLPEELV